MSQPAVNGQPGYRKDQSLTPSTVPGEVVDAEVLPRAQRRRFSADYKRRLLQEADQCCHLGQVGALRSAQLRKSARADIEVSALFYCAPNGAGERASGCDCGKQGVGLSLRPIYLPADKHSKGPYG